MTNPDSIQSMRFALLTNGSRFSCAVLEQLRKQDFKPSLLVLPEYPPASGDDGLFQVRSAREFLSLMPGVETAYAPRDWQSQCAEQIRRLEIEYILVACWPYLINNELRDSPIQVALNLHPSRLPLYRGADPIQQQIDAKDLRAGVTLHLLNEEFDRGDIVDQHSFDIDFNQLETDYLEAHCAASGVDLFIAALRSGQKTWQLISQMDQALDTD